MLLEYVQNVVWHCLAEISKAFPFKDSPELGHRESSAFLKLCLYAFFSFHGRV